MRARPAAAGLVIAVLTVHLAAPWHFARFH